MADSKAGDVKPERPRPDGGEQGALLYLTLPFRCMWGPWGGAGGARLGFGRTGGSGCRPARAVLGERSPVVHTGTGCRVSVCRIAQAGGLPRPERSPWRVAPL